MYDKIGTAWDTCSEHEGEIRFQTKGGSCLEGKVQYKDTGRGRSSKEAVNLSAYVGDLRYLTAKMINQQKQPASIH